MNKTTSFFKIIILLFLFPIFNQATAQVPFTCDGRPIVFMNYGLKYGLFFMNINTEAEEVTLDTISASSAHVFQNLSYNAKDNLLYGLTTEDNATILAQIDAMGSITYLDTFYLDINLWNPNIYAAEISLDANNLYFFITPHTNGDLVMLGTYDLSSPDYNLSFRTTMIPYYYGFGGLSPNPISGLFYGFLSPKFQLFIFDADNGASSLDLTTFPLAPQEEVHISLYPFFDPFINLWGFSYATINQLEVSTGIVKEVFHTSEYIVNSLCSCPYTTRMRLTTERDSVFPCATVDYTISISNLLQNPQENLELKLEFPTNFKITEVSYNAYSGTIISGAASNTLHIKNLDFPKGVDSIVMQVLIPEDIDGGTYYCQAKLSNLDLSSANDTTTGIFSDYPLTFAPFDSTPIVVTPLVFDPEGYSVELCPDSTLVIGTNLPEAGLYFLWDNVSVRASTGLLVIMVFSPWE